MQIFMVDKNIKYLHLSYKFLFKKIIYEILRVKQQKYSKIKREIGRKKCDENKRWNNATSYL